MKPHAKSALALALAIVGGIAAGMRCDASEWVDNPSQTNPRVAAYTVKTYIEGSDPFDAMMLLVAVAAAFSAWADTETVGGYTWTYRTNGYTAEIMV